MDIVQNNEIVMSEYVWKYYKKMILDDILDINMMSNINFKFSKHTVHDIIYKDIFLTPYQRMLMKFPIHVWREILSEIQQRITSTKYMYNEVLFFYYFRYIETYILFTLENIFPLLSFKSGETFMSDYVSVSLAFLKKFNHFRRDIELFGVNIRCRNKKIVRMKSIPSNLFCYVFYNFRNKVLKRCIFSDVYYLKVFDTMHYFIVFNYNLQSHIPEKEIPAYYRFLSEY